MHVRDGTAAHRHGWDMRRMLDRVAERCQRREPRRWLVCGRSKLSSHHPRPCRLDRLVPRLGRRTSLDESGRRKRPPERLFSSDQALVSPWGGKLPRKATGRCRRSRSLVPPEHGKAPGAAHSTASHGPRCLGITKPPARKTETVSRARDPATGGQPSRRIVII